MEFGEKKEWKIGTLFESEKRVCHGCIGNAALKKYIKANGEIKQCSYCGRRWKSVPFELFYDAIMDGIGYAYSRAVDELPVDEGEFVGNTYSSDDLIYDELSEEINAQDERILDDIVAEMPDEVWCDAEPYGDMEDRDYYSWETFSKMVREKMRFVFYRADTTEYYPDNPVGILDCIGSYAKETRLTRRIDKSTKLFRCRTLDEKKGWFTTPEDFAPPEAVTAGPGRMNAAGINMLYLTLEEETALREVYAADRERAVVVRYRVEEPLYVLDLARLEKMKLPSIFDAERREMSHAIKFLKMFAEDISKPKTNKNTDTEYVPTQIVTEYFRYVKPKNRDRYDGILYKSAQNPNGTCLVLFMNREEVLEGKHGIRIVPSDTTFYQKRYELLENEETTRAKGELAANSMLKRYSDTPINPVADIAASSKELYPVKQV